jgi:hypothetical protein
MVNAALRTQPCTKENTMSANATTQTPEIKAHQALRSKARQLIADNLHPDTVGISKGGRLLCRWGFFYTHGRTSAKYVEAVQKLLAEHGIGGTVVDHGSVWKDFRGGASVANQSHFYVEIEIG